MIAFPPDFRDSGYFFVLANVQPSCALRLSRFRVSANPDSADLSSEEIVFQIPLPYDSTTFPNIDHGQPSMVFGKDSLLYVAIPHYGQLCTIFPNTPPEIPLPNPLAVYGNIQRLDVRSLPYSIPPTNPHVGSLDTLPEIYVYDSLSSPPSMTLDRVTGEIFIYDDGSCGFYNPRLIYRLSPGETSLKLLEVISDGEQFVSPETNVIPYRGNRIPSLRGRLFHNIYPLSRVGEDFNSIGKIYEYMAAKNFSTTFDSSGVATAAKHDAELIRNVPFDDVLKIGMFPDPHGEIVALDRGGRLLRLDGCCIGLKGNVDCDPEESVDLIDLTILVDHLFGSFAPLCCRDEGDVIVDNSIDLVDLSALVDYLFISFTPLSFCE